MKTYNVTSLPETLEHKGQTLKIFIKGNLPAWKLEEQGLTVCFVACMSKNLRGNTDLHGRAYTPTNFIYCEMNPEEYDSYRDTVEFWKKQFSPRTSKWQSETLKTLRNETSQSNPFAYQTREKIQALKEIKAAGISKRGVL